MKPVCDRLARLWADEPNRLSLRLLQMMTACRRVPSDPAEDGGDMAPANPRSPIGIWAPDAGGGRGFTRVAAADPDGLSSGTQRIPPKGRRKRVLLIGESVARGFFYDPYFSPAAALSSVLDRALRQRPEVIDLAQTGLSFPALMELLRSAPRLAPDAIVVAAGNNWHPFQTWSPAHSARIAAVLRAGGSWADVKAQVIGWLEALTGRFLAAARVLAREHRIPLVCVIPEFNLEDWRDSTTPVPLLANGQLGRWLAARDEAAGALTRGDGERAAALGRLMTEIDGSTSPAGYYLVADGLRGVISIAERRCLLEHARDAAISLTGPESPRCHAAISSTLRAKATQHGLHLVDLPRALPPLLGGDLPDRRTFHDYCHLTADGIQAAMTLVAECLIPVLGGKLAPALDLMAVPAVAPRAVAEANLLAAVYNSTWGQSPDVIRFHIDRALTASPDVIASMRLVLDYKIQRAPALLCGAFDRLVMSAGPGVVARLVERRRDTDRLAVGFISAMASRLDVASPGAAAWTAQEVIRIHGVPAGGGRDLLEARYCCSPLPAERNWRETSGVYRAYDDVSRFVLVWGDENDLALSICWRTPPGVGAAAGRPIDVLINDVPVWTSPPACGWSAATVPIPPQVLVRGGNDVGIRWPRPDGADPQLHALMTALENHTPPEVPLLFGELQELRVARPPPAPAGPRRRVASGQAELTIAIGEMV
jgi:hypothetical protein